MPRILLATFCISLTILLTGCEPSFDDSTDTKTVEIDVEIRVKNCMFPRAEEASRLFDLVRDTSANNLERKAAIQTLQNVYGVKLNLATESNTLDKAQYEVISQIKEDCIEEIRKEILNQSSK